MSVAVREHAESDLEAYCEWQSDPAVAAFVSWLPRSRTQSEAGLRDAILQQRAARRERYFFAVVEPISGDVVGDVGFTVLQPGVGDCGWFIRRRFWGKGFATDAVRQMMVLAFEDVGLQRLVASCAKGNLASQRVMQKCGFINTHNTADRRYYSLPKDDWRKNR